MYAITIDQFYIHFSNIYKEGHIYKKHIYKERYTKKKTYIDTHIYWNIHKRDIYKNDHIYGVHTKGEKRRENIYNEK